MNQGELREENRSVYRAGYLAAVVVAVTYLVIFALFARTGVPPTTGDAWMHYLPGKTAVWWSILALCVATDVLWIPVAFALHQALKRVNSFAVSLGVACVGLFVVLDLAVTWTNYAALLTLAQRYAAASTDAQRMSYVAAAQVPASILASPLEAVYAIGDLSLGVVILGAVMLARGSGFNKPTAYLGIVTGVIGMAAVSGWFGAVLLNAVLTIVWLFFVAHALRPLAKSR